MKGYDPWSQNTTVSLQGHSRNGLVKIGELVKIKPENEVRNKWKAIESSIFYCLFVLTEFMLCILSNDVVKQKCENIKIFCD